jgi:uncharacterized membrane protein YfcA
MLDPAFLWLFGLLVAVGAFTQGFTGLGFGIIILAGISFTTWDLERCTVIISLLVVTIHMVIILSSRREGRIQWPMVGFVLAGLALGVPLGYLFILTYGNQPVIQLVLGVTLTGFALNELFKPRFRKALPRFMGFPAGVLGGFLGGAFTTSGPPLAIYIYSQNEDPSLLKSTLQTVFFVTNLWRLVNIQVYGPGIGWPVLKITLLAVPLVAIFGFWGHRLSRRASSRFFLRSVYALIALSGCANMVRALM